MATSSNKRAAIVVALLPLALGIVLFAVGIHFHGEQHQAVRPVSAAEVLDRQQVKAGEYVSVHGQVGPLSTTYGGIDRSVLFALHGYPGLVLVCPHAAGGCNRTALKGRQDFSGRLYNGGHYVGSDGLPALAIDQFAKHALKLPGQSAVRVVNLSEMPNSNALSSVVAFVFAGLLTAVSLLLLLLTALGILPRPRQAGRRAR